MQVELRAASATDLDPIVVLLLGSRRDPSAISVASLLATWSEDSLREHWGAALRDPDQRVVLAVDQARLVAVAHLTTAPDEESTAVLHSLYVEPSAADQGVGGELLHHAISLCSESGLSALQLWVFGANLEAIGFFESQGWTHDGRVRVHSGERQLGMRRALGPGHQMRAEMASQPAVLERMLTRRPAFLDVLRSTVGEVHGVILVARGSSDNAAVYGRYILELALKRPVALAAPSLWTRYGLAEDLRGQLVVAVSQSGRTPEIVSTLEAMRAAGATTVAISNEINAPLMEHADVRLALGVGPERAVPATKTFIAQLAMFAVLAEALGSGAWSELDWATVPAIQRALLADCEPAVSAAGILAAAQANAQLGRGLLYAIALEGALKLRETASIPASGFASADFLHGPVAASGPSLSTVAYIAPGPVAHDVEQAAQAAQRAGSPLVVVGEHELAGAVNVPVAAGVSEALAPLVHIIRAQQLALHTALALDSDPDTPRGLRKVTVTL
jgi:glucosamine--fructose-6-phosphate aminotransferase (isomerizing)